MLPIAMAAITVWRAILVVFVVAWLIFLGLLIDYLAVVRPRLRRAGKLATGRPLGPWKKARRRDR